jgi:hypothetical protein
MILVLGVVACAVAPAAGHHSFSAYYFEDRSMTVEGALIEFEYRAPHAWVRVEAPDESGRLRTYAAEWNNPSRLTRDGITKDTLRAGDRLVVTGSPGRNAGEYKLHLKKVVRPSDGWTWEARRRP